jgi:hypothetical protein
MRIYCWIVAGLYLVFGILFFRVIVILASILSATDAPLMLLTRFTLWLGPWGWLTLMIIFSVFAGLGGWKLPSIRSRISSTIAIWAGMAAALLWIVCVSAIFMLQPVCVLRDYVRP